MSMPDRLSALSVASCETDTIVTVAEPIAVPACEAAIASVSSASSSWSSEAVTSAVADGAPAKSVSAAGTSV